jgi:hypothetical protein
MTERRLAIDMGELEAAFEDASDTVRYYLDRETGLVMAITDEIRDELEAIYEELDDEHGQEADLFAEALQQRDLPEWMRAMVYEAHAVEQGYGTRYIAVPTADSREGYRDMEDFIATIGSPQLRAQLAYAIQGRGAFRRFKDTLLAHPDERERWFAFRQARVRGRVLAWLAEEGIAVVTEAGEDNQPLADREQEKSGSAS